MEKKFLNPETEAFRILVDHTRGYLDVSGSNEKVESMSADEMFDSICEEVALLLTDRLVNGKYSIKQYLLVRNELAKLLDRLHTKELNQA